MSLLSSSLSSMKFNREPNFFKSSLKFYIEHQLPKILLSDVSTEESGSDTAIVFYLFNRNENAERAEILFFSNSKEMSERKG